MGGGETQRGGKVGVHLARGGALVLPQPANAHAHGITRGGAGRRQALGVGGEQAHACAWTRRMRTAAWSSGNRANVLERLHGLIPGEGVARDQEVPTMETGQQFRLRDDALWGVESFGGSHGHLLVSVLSTLARFEGQFFAHDNPISLTGWVLLYCEEPLSTVCN